LPENVKERPRTFGLRKKGLFISVICGLFAPVLTAQGTPEIFNTDQGAQFTAQAFTTTVEAAGSRMSMDGKGRALDNIFIERL
jgi:transposase InsO family protein